MEDRINVSKGTRPSNWMSIGVLFSLYILSNVDRYIIAVLVTPIKESLGATDFQMSLLMGLAFGVFYSICALPMGWIVDRVARKWVIACSTIVWSAASMACGLATGYAQLFIARMFVGLGESALTPSAYSYLSDRFQRHQLGRAISFFGVAAVVGVSLAILVGGTLLSLVSETHIPFLAGRTPWQMVFILTGLPALILAFFAFAIREPARTGQEHGGKATTKDFIRFLKSNRKLSFAILGSYVAMMFGSFSMVVWTPAFLERTMGWSHSETGIILGLMFLGFAGSGQAVGGIVVDAWLKRGRLDAPLRYFLLAVMIGTPAATIGFVLPIGHFAIAFIAIALFFLVAYLGYAAAAIQLVTPNEFRGQASALFLFAINGVACVIGPAITGALTTYLFADEARVGWSIAIVIVASGSVAAYFSWLGLPHLEKAIRARSAPLPAKQDASRPRPALTVQ